MWYFQRELWDTDLFSLQQLDFIGISGRDRNHVAILSRREKKNECLSFQVSLLFCTARFCVYTQMELDDDSIPDLWHYVSTRTPHYNPKSIPREDIKQFLENIHRMMLSGQSSILEAFSLEYPTQYGAVVLFRGSPGKGKAHSIKFPGKKNFAKSELNGLCTNTAIIPSDKSNFSCQLSQEIELSITEYRLAVHKDESAKDNNQFPRLLVVHRRYLLSFSP